MPNLSTGRVPERGSSPCPTPSDEFRPSRQSLDHAHAKESHMSADPVRRVNLAAVTCDPRPQLPDGFRRHSTRVGAQLGAARTGLSVYELPPGQAVSPYHYEDPEEEWL